MKITGDNLHLVLAFTLGISAVFMLTVVMLCTTAIVIRGTYLQVTKSCTVAEK